MIPRDRCRALGVDEGDELLIPLEEGRVILTRPEQYARATREALKGAWGKNQQEGAPYLNKKRQSWE